MLTFLFTAAVPENVMKVFPTKFLSDERHNNKIIMTQKKRLQVLGQLAIWYEDAGSWVWTPRKRTKVKVQGFQVRKMTIEMTDKRVTSFRFNEIKIKKMFDWVFNRFYFL